MAIARETARQRIAASNAQRAQKEAVSELKRMEKEAVRQRKEFERQNITTQKEYERALKQAEKEAKAQYLADRVEEVEQKNAEISEILMHLENLLANTLAKNDLIKFSSLRISDAPPKLLLPPNLTTPQPKPEERQFLDKIDTPTGFASIWPPFKKRHEMKLIEARKRFAEEMERWQEAELLRLQALTEAELEHQDRLMAFEQKKAQRDAEVDALEADYNEGDPEAIVSYNTMVLERSSYPQGFPQNFSIAYTSASKQLVIEYELPNATIVPAVTEFKYVKTSDAISQQARKVSEIRELYQGVVASVALRTIHEVFEADQGFHIEVVCFNGYVHTIDPATGRDIQPHLISVRVTRGRFAEIELSRVDKTACLRNLGAQVSRQPEEAAPVKPIVEFNLADARFVDQNDLVSGLSSATNLMELTPSEFEHLVANLFGKMGLESKLTRSSRDGGVDCVAYDKRPVLGGKVVIQAKRYKNTVGVAAVRDLFGTMMNEGANKGILVATSGYGRDAISRGTNLLSLSMGAACCFFCKKSECRRE